LNAVWDLFDVPDKTPPQRVRMVLDRDHPLLIVQSPGGKNNNEPFETRLTNNERPRGKDRSVVASELDYLLRALGEKGKPKSNREYMTMIQKHAGREFGADIRYSWTCSKEREKRAKDQNGAFTKIEGSHGCGEKYYQEDVPKDANGQVPFEVMCSACGNWMNAWANLDNLRS